MLPPCWDWGWGGGRVDRHPTPVCPICQILRWPKPCASDQVVTKTMVNTVVADPSFNYLTALTDSNIVAIWRRS